MAELIQCSLCTEHFPTVVDMNTHSDDTHGLHTCSCASCASKNAVFPVVVKNNDNQVVYNCAICSKKFLSICKCWDHCGRVHVAEPFECCECDSTFKNVKDLHGHLRMHAGSSVMVRCGYCKASSNEKTFKNMHALNAHVKTVHNFAKETAMRKQAKLQQAPKKNQNEAVKTVKKRVSAEDAEKKLGEPAKSDQNSNRILSSEVVSSGNRIPKDEDKGEMPQESDHSSRSNNDEEQETVLERDHDDSVSPEIDQETPQDTEQQNLQASDNFSSTQDETEIQKQQKAELDVTSMGETEKDDSQSHNKNPIDGNYEILQETGHISSQGEVMEQDKPEESDSSSSIPENNETSFKDNQSREDDTHAENAVSKIELQAGLFGNDSVKQDDTESITLPSKISPLQAPKEANDMHEAPSTQASLRSPSKESTAPKALPRPTKKASQKQNVTPSRGHGKGRGRPPKSATPAKPSLKKTQSVTPSRGRGRPAKNATSAKPSLTPPKNTAPRKKVTQRQSSTKRNLSGDALSTSSSEPGNTVEDPWQKKAKHGDIGDDAGTADDSEDEDRALLASAISSGTKRLDLTIKPISNNELEKFGILPTTSVPKTPQLMIHDVRSVAPQSAHTHDSDSSTHTEPRCPSAGSEIIHITPFDSISNHLITPPSVNRDQYQTHSSVVGNHMCQRCFREEAVNTTCQHCGIVFLDEDVYTLHKLLHDRENPFKCTGCGKECQSRLQFTTHIFRYPHP